MTWVPVPLGAGRNGGMVQELLVPSVPLKYPQFELNTCAFMSLASALHYCAATMKMGDKGIACLLATVATSYVHGKNARDQLNLLSRLVIEKGSYFRKFELRAKSRTIDLWDLPNSHNRFPTVVVLRAVDGSTDPSVVIVIGLVFDSNAGNAMRLRKPTLNWCCNCKGRYEGALYALQFWH